MGCRFSGLNALYDAANGGGDVWINENRFRIVRQLGEGGFAYAYLVKEFVNDVSSSSSDSGGGLAKKAKDKSHLSGYTRTKLRSVFVISSSPGWNTILSCQGYEDEKEVLFYLRCTPDISADLCRTQAYNLDPPYVHNDVTPGNILITNRKRHHPLAMMDFGSTHLQGDKFDPVQKLCSCRSGHRTIVQRLIEPLSFGTAQVMWTSMRGLIYGL